MSEWVVTHNRARAVTGSIHDDEAARQLGFTGGLVPGNVHVALVTRELVQVLGQDWYERGFLRHAWIRPVYEGEEVRVELDGKEFQLVRRDGTVVAAGEAGLGSGPPWEQPGLTGDYDPFPTDPIGVRYPTQTVTVGPEAVERGLAGYDDNPWYRDSSPWGGPVVPTVSQLVLGGREGPRLEIPAAVREEMRAGMNATSEIVHSGPVFVGVPYERGAWLVEKGVEGRHGVRTIEFAWRDRDERVVSRSRWRIKWVTARTTVG